MQIVEKFSHSFANSLFLCYIRTLLNLRRFWRA